MPGVTVDGGDPVAVYEHGRRRGRARALRRRPDARRVARLPPERARQHHRPARRAAPLPGARGDHGLRQRPRSTRRRSAATRCRASAPGSSPTGTLTAEEADADRRGRCGPRCRRRSPSGSRARFPAPEDGRRTTSTPSEEPRTTWHASFPTSPRSERRSTRRWSATTTVLYFGQNLATTENDPFLQAFGERPRPRDADLRDGRDRDGGRRRVRRLPARRRAVHGRVHARRDGPGRERGAALPLHDRRPGQGADRAQGRLRLHRRLGRAAHGLDLRHVHGRPGPQGRGAGDGGRREGPDDRRDPRRQPGRPTSTTTC